MMLGHGSCPMLIEIINKISPYRTASSVDVDPDFSERQFNLES